MKAVRGCKFFALLGLMVFSAPALWSAESKPTFAELKSTARAYVSPPEYKLFAGYKLPDEAGVIKAGEKVRVFDKTTVGYPWYRENWFLVQAARSEKPVWVYGGTKEHPVLKQYTSDKLKLSEKFEHTVIKPR